MQLHETLARFADIVGSYEVQQYEVEGLHSRLKLNVMFVDGSQLYAREVDTHGLTPVGIYFGAWGTVQRGEALIAQGQWAGGVTQVQQGLAAYEGDLSRTAYLAWLAGGMREQGRPSPLPPEGEGTLKERKCSGQ